MDLFTDRKIETSFNPFMLAQLNTIMTNIEMSDNNEKADEIIEYLEQFGFEEVGCGTNRIVVAKKGDDEVVYKIALDTVGVKDNNLEHDLSKRLQPYVTISYENIGLISAAERVETMASGDFLDYSEKVHAILVAIGYSYILNDVGPKSFMNWGVRNDGAPVILDYAYLTPITNKTDFRCKRSVCGGQLVYNKDFTQFVCVECGSKFSLGDIQSTVYDELVEMGFNTSGVSNADEVISLPGFAHDVHVNENVDEYGFNMSTNY